MSVPAPTDADTWDESRRKALHHALMKGCVTAGLLIASTFTATRDRSALQRSVQDSGLLGTPYLQTVERQRGVAHPF